MPPNILIFMSDQERADVLDPNHPCISPNATQLAQDGVTFTETYCPSPHCCPSRATFFTGMYPSKHGVFNNVSNASALNRGLNDGIVTFGEPLREAGYRLLFSGKWHVSDAIDPSDVGWEEVHLTAGKGSYMQQSMAFYQDMIVDDEPRKHGQIKRPGWGDLQLFGSYENKGEKGYEDSRDYKVIEEACNALSDLKESDQPWVLYVGTIGPHDPFIIPQHYLDMYDLDDVPLPENYHDTLDDKPAVYRRMREQYWGQMSADETRDAIRHYWAYCTMIDDMFGDVLDALDETGQADDTVVIRMSDHGEYCGNHGVFFKGIPSFKEGYHVPTIIRYPQVIEETNRTVDEFVSLADFAPTFYEIAGIDIPDNLTGRSLLPFLKGETPDDWRDAHYAQVNAVELYYSQRAVQTKQYKYVYNGFDMDELYDLENDPHEIVNRVNDPTLTDVKRELVRKMWRFAYQEQDERIFNGYGTVALAPWGPGDALEG